ncbi:uncharacterized protein LOC131017229 [Salvia miltiorrhiza]|uniref:uncharacterized protein LOC131017229 n=2 Tax=Salvia miltiorrhiza TaxID=226208 RepID=UPI0025AC6AFE|nr:uncharacterized protein LOC131017229 [Salvia miltiorrhiza]
MWITVLGSRVYGTGNRKTYHFYGPIWALQIWSYEAIPRLGRACGMRDTRLQMPRLVNWTTWKSASDFTHFFDAHEAECHRTLEPVEEENDSWYLQTLRHPEPFSVRYHPGGKYAGLTEPVVPEPPPPVRPPPVQRSISRAERTREKQPVPVPRSSSRAERAREKQPVPVHVERHRQTYEEPGGSPSKRRRSEEFDDREPQADRDEDYWRRRDEDLIARITQEQIRTVVPEMRREIRRELVDDDSEHGLVAKITKKVIAAVKDIFGRRSSSRRHRSSSSHASRHRHGSEEYDQPSPSRRRSTSHIPSPRRSEREDPPHVSHRHSVGDMDPPRGSQRRSERGEDPPRASQRRSASRHSEREASMRRSASHHGEGQTSLRRSASRHSDRPGPSAGYQRPETPAPKAGDVSDDLNFSWTSSEEEAGARERPQLVIDPDLPYGKALLKAKKRGFKAFMRSPPGTYVQVIETGWVMSQELFHRILNPRVEFDGEILDLWNLKALRRLRQNQQWIARGQTRLVAGVTRERTPIAFLDFYETLFREFRSLHPDEQDWDNIRDRHGYEEWVVPEKLIAMFHGTDSGHTWPWLEAKEIIAMCNLDKSHWCTVVISISAWEVRVYDSLIHVEGARKRRENAMKPITRLMPKLLHTVGYYAHNTVRYVAAPDRPMKVVIMPIREQFIQEDSVSCGVFACAYLDRLICGAPTREQLRTPAQIQKFRQIIAIRIWELCTDPPPIHFS